MRTSSPFKRVRCSSSSTQKSTVDVGASKASSRRYCSGDSHSTFTLRHVEVEERPDLAERFRIAEVPTLLVVADRRVQARLEHPKGCRQIEAILAPWLH